MIGQTFGHWSVVATGATKYGSAHWLCRCTCGMEREVKGLNLNNGRSTSCGKCSRIGAESATFKHGKTHTVLHNIWLSMKDRCNNPNGEFYHRYGGRGIKVCLRWQNDFSAFEADMGQRPSPKHSIDRYPDNDGNYEPGNCRWATKLEQSNNREVTLRDDNGKTLAEISSETGLDYFMLHKRFKLGARGSALIKPSRSRKMSAERREREEFAEAAE